MNEDVADIESRLATVEIEIETLKRAGAECPVSLQLIVAVEKTIQNMRDFKKSHAQSWEEAEDYREVCATLPALEKAMAEMRKVRNGKRTTTQT